MRELCMMITPLPGEIPPLKEIAEHFNVPVDSLNWHEIQQIHDGNRIMIYTDKDKETL